MRIETSDGPPLLITSSPVRQEVAGYCGFSTNLPREVSSLLLKAIGEEEERIHRERKNNTPISPMRFSSDSSLILVEIATAKAEAVRRVIEELIGSNSWNYEWGKLPFSFMTVDSAWAINLAPTYPIDLISDDEKMEKILLIHKPRDRRDFCLVIESLRIAGLKGAHLQSISAICRMVIQEDGSCLRDISLVVVDYGELNPDFDWQKLENLMGENSHFAGGFSTKELLDGLSDLVKPTPFIKVRIIKGKQQELFELSKDATNFPQIIAMSVGLLPHI